MACVPRTHGAADRPSGKLRDARVSSQERANGIDKRIANSFCTERLVELLEKTFWQLPREMNPETNGKLLHENENDDVFRQNSVKKSVKKRPEIRLYKRRFVVLGIFCLYSMSSAFQWIEYAIITNIVVEYFNVTELAVQWTSMIYMASYIPLMFVATWMLDKWGLRKVVLFGATLNAAGSLIKAFTVQPNLFGLSFLGQTISACAQSFILEIPPKIASVWFGPSEVSTATAIGVFGNQLGVAIGFLLPPVIVTGYSSMTQNVYASSNESTTSLPTSNETYSTNAYNESFTTTAQPMDMDVVGHQLRILFTGSAVVCTVVLLLAIAIFKDEPPHPPSLARKLSVATEMSNKEKHSNSFSNYKRSLGVLLRNVPFLLLFVTYGINTGTYYAIGTLLNPIMIPYHPDAQKQIGEIGLTMVVAGLVGSVLCGYFLDKTKLFKMTTVATYAFSMIFMIVFTFTLQLKQLWLDYVSIGVLGFFMTGYLPIGFEFAAEITYPESEATSAGFLNVSAQFFGILFTMVTARFMDLSILAGNLFMSVALLIGTILTALIREDLLRQKANSSKLPEDNTAEVPENGHLLKQQQSNGGADENLARMTSTSSCYSTGGNG